MPGTLKEAAKLAGVEWDEKRFETDAEYQRQLATAYYEAQLKRFGHPVIAAVAYNAGPNLVQDWIDGTNRTGKNPKRVRLGPFYGGIEGWVSRIPFSETRQYAEKFMARVSERQGSGTPPATLEDALLSLRNHRFLANNPKRLEIAENRLRFIYAARKESEQERRAKNMETVMDIVIGSKGDMSQVPVSLFNALSPADRLTIMDLSDKLVRLGDVTKPEDFLALQELLIEPEKLRQTPARDIAMWKARLSNQDFNDLKTRWLVVNGAGPPDPKLGTVLDYAEINTVFNNKFDQEMPKYNKNNPAHVQRRAILLNQVQDRIREHQMRLGRQLNSDEIAKTVDVLFMTPSRYWRKYLWRSEQPENLQEERVVDMWVGNIPPELRDEIKEYLKANGVLPTDAAIYREFVSRKYSAFERELADRAEKNQR
jgi:soluble lytic murein transglycosylase